MVLICGGLLFDLSWSVCLCQARRPIIFPLTASAPFQQLQLTMSEHPHSCLTVLGKNFAMQTEEDRVQLKKG
jgi:hypothetical protein